MAKAQGGLKTCENCRSNMSMFADVCPHCGHRAYGAIFGGRRRRAEAAAATAKGDRAVEQLDPGFSAREQARKADFERNHAYCSVFACSRRLYAGEIACEAGHQLVPTWERVFKTAFGVEPEPRPGGPLKELQRQTQQSSDSGDKVQRLKDLVELRDSGALTAEEFETLKAEVIG